uniref:Uncharacterized protein n=1 Tax=Cucumis melo TaxID=3656 RepID=A0A9I9DGQ7_CUCME
MVLDLNVDRNDIEAGQEEEFADSMVNASEVPIEDVGVFVMPMDCSDVEDGVPPFQSFHLTNYNSKSCVSTYKALPLLP